MQTKIESSNTKECDSPFIEKITPDVHKRILEFLNRANVPEDLMFLVEIPPVTEGEHHGGSNHPELRPQPEKILDEKTARRVLEFRERACRPRHPGMKCLV